jgi:hypothetical protein
VADEPSPAGDGAEPPAVGEPQSSGPVDEALAARLAVACRRMADLDLPAAETARLQRQFIAVCDSVKAAGADEAAGERRLAAFLAALDSAERDSDPRI